MNPRQPRLLSLSLVLALLLTLAPWGGAAFADSHTGELVAEGFNGPMGILVAPDGSIWVIDSGLGGETEFPFLDPASGQETTARYGDSARIVRIDETGEQTVVANLPSIATGQDMLGGARLALLDGTLYATSSQWLGDPTTSPPVDTIAAVVKVEDGAITAVANTWAFEAANNPDGLIYDSHPYGLAAGPDGMLWVADAAANDLLKVDPATGAIELVTVFEGIPAPFPNPIRGDAMETDPVPTGVTVGADGNVYVALLSGFPFTPGSAKVMQISADGAAVDYATGLTMLTDVQAGPDGSLYAVQFAVFGEQGPVPNSGAIVRVQEGDASQVVVEGLSFPTAIAFNEAGDAYVTVNGVGAPGSGAVMKFAGLASGDMAGAEMGEEESMAETPAVHVSDQETDGTQVTVDQVVAAEAGWLVIHADGDGRPGPVIGKTAVPAGTTDNVVVVLDEPIYGETTLWAMLHVDAGEIGTYEFPGADGPVRVDDAVVVSPFTATAPEMMAEEPPAEEEEMAEASETAEEEVPPPDQLPQTGVAANSLPSSVAVAGLVLLALVGGVAWRRRQG